MTGFLNSVGPPLKFTLMTTTHARGRLEDALWFAFYNAMPPDDLHATLDTVVIAVDKPSLASACVRWIRLNHE
jgi:hypothetical protein